MACIKRTVDDVESLIELAKLSSNDLLSTTQTLEFPCNYDPHNITLMQMPETLLAQLKEGDRLILRGDADDCAVLCTESHTYEVREAETSNALVLVEGLRLPEEITETALAADCGMDRRRILLHKEVSGIYYKYMEARGCMPRLHKLRTLLEENPYKGPDAEEDNIGGENRKYTFAELLDRVQASEDELRDALDAMPAVHIHGHYRMLAFDYEFKVLSDILALIEEETTSGWSIDGVPGVQVLQRLTAVEPKAVVQCLFSHYFALKSATDDDASTGAASTLPPPLYRLRDDRLCRFFAEVLLRNADNFDLAEFLSMWQLSVPVGVSTSLDQLGGLALVDRDRTPPVVWYYPASALSADLSERFTALFKARDKWTLADITPYLQAVSSSTCSVSALLAKYARASTHNGVKHYTAKHAR